MRTSMTLIATTVLMISCKSSSQQETEQTQTDSAETIATTSEASTAPAARGFDYNAVPVSSEPLGAFPYFSLPEGYQNSGNNEIADYDRFYVWVGDHFERPEGKIFYDRVTAKEGKSYSDLELARSLDELISSVGGVKISEGTVPQDSAYNNIPQDHRLKYISGYGFIGYKVTTIYLIRRADRNIWIQFTPADDGASMGWAVVETKPFKQTASLIKAEEIKKELDSKGHIALYINFDTDKSTIKPDSKPVIEEIQRLLNNNPALKVLIEGHTDNSGAPDHNRKLSEERAQSVKSALTAGGIDAARLQAKGLGQDKPVADNASEEGKAKNRRVEIVKM